MTHATCRLTAKNRDQLRNRTLGNRVWATFPFLRCGIVCVRGRSGVGLPVGVRGQRRLERDLLLRRSRRLQRLASVCRPTQTRLSTASCRRSPAPAENRPLTPPDTVSYHCTASVFLTVRIRLPGTSVPLAVRGGIKRHRDPTVCLSSRRIES